MSNMSYCRFHNTAIDLDACKDALEELLGAEGAEPLSGEELMNAKRLVATCLDIVLNVAEAAGMDANDLDGYSAERGLVDAIDKANIAAADLLVERAALRNAVVEAASNEPR